MFLFLFYFLLLIVEFNVIKAYPSLKAGSSILVDTPVTSVRNPRHLYTTEVATTLR